MKRSFLCMLFLVVAVLLVCGCSTFASKPPRFQRLYCWGVARGEENTRKFAEIGVTDIRVITQKDYDLAVKYGMTPYCGTFLPAGPHPQVITKEEAAYRDYVKGKDLDKALPKEERAKILLQRKLEKGYRYGGEPDNGAMNVMTFDTPCFNSDENYAMSKKKIDGILAKAIPGVKGIYFDGIGYTNLHGCYCEKCLRDYRAFLERNKLADTQANKDLFYRELLVNYFNAMIDYVKEKRPDFKVLAHYWPSFEPDPLFANRTKVDYCCQTVAWYFQWPLDKVTNYTKYVLKHAKKYHSNSEGIPFVGLNAKQGEALAYKSPEQLEIELQTILAAGGRTLLVCNGHDMIKPGFYEVFKKYCGKVESRL
ncbi:MAG: hypothetical protein J5746_08615 [Victivallales bacterium]|nr:hypothetical protein [Victivallales bacterium]